MITRFAVRIRRLKRRFTRSYWALRLLGLSKSEDPAHSPGLILIQVDGLSQKQLHRALKNGNMPFLKRLIEREKYVDHTHYSGLPSSTPAVQGELFYGVKSCVPAFQFLDDQTKRIFTMYEAKSATEIELRLQKENEPLLKGGSSYSNIFSGGAEEAHFCSTSLNWGSFFKTINPFTWPIIIIFHLDVLIKTVLLLIMELFLALFDALRGAFAGQKFWMELQFVLTRVFISMMLRELVVLGAKVDIARGLPIVHLNFVGYDEQSHRRGPSSSFAHWCLRGIDDGIRRVTQEANRAERRNYDVWIYSDHGQEETKPYPTQYKRRVESVIAEIFGEVISTIPKKGETTRQHTACCQGRFSWNIFRKKISEETTEPAKPNALVAGMGPLAHIYPSTDLDMEAKEKVADKLLESGRVPLVLIAGKEGEVLAKMDGESYKLPQDKAKILGENHPFLEEVTEDLISLCHNPKSGKIIISGWCAGKKATTFPIENGSHAGFSPQETNGFALLPIDAPVKKNKNYLRPLDIRAAAFKFLGRSKEEKEEIVPPPTLSKTIRVMTYNVHGCVGMDGKLSPERIARVIARYKPDIVALQELDVKRHRSGGVDQAEVIARKLNMNYHFHSSFLVGDEKYGNAVLSRYPMRVVRMSALPKLHDSRQYEPRGALWVEIDMNGLKVNLFNSHLSLWPKEKIIQTEALLGEDWIGNEACREPVILCGDFNSRPKSLVCKRMSCRLRDAQTILETHEPIGTWFSRHPFYRIDHIFVSSNLNVLNISVPHTELERAASDHAPLIAELQVTQS